MKANNLRNYEGLRTVSKPCGVPKATKIEESVGPWSQVPASELECPHCGCKEVMQIEVDLESRMLKGGKGVGYYIGCPACPWASPMMSIATSGDPDAVE